MTVTLVFLAVLMAAFVYWLIRQTISVRPWVAESTAPERMPFVPESATAARVGLGVFLAVVTALFALTISAYMMRMELAGDWRPLPEPGLLWLNTAFLVLASAFLQWAWHAAKGEREGPLRIAIAGGGIFTVAFIAGQYLAWLQLVDAGYYASANPANAFFYMLTALHALHLVGGLVAWSWILIRLLGRTPAQALLPNVELCAVYWHFLLLVWAVLFGLVLST